MRLNEKSPSQVRQAFLFFSLLYVYNIIRYIYRYGCSPYDYV